MSETPEFDDVIEFMEDGEYAEAIAILDQLISDAPDASNYFYHRGLAHYELDNLENAVADFSTTLRLYPQSYNALKWRAFALDDLGRHIDAATDQRQLVEAQQRGENEMNPLDWSRCATSYVLAGDPDNAIEVLEEYLSSSRKMPKEQLSSEMAPVRTFVPLLLERGETDRALELAKKAFENKYCCPMDVLNYARALEAAGDIQKAVEIAARAAEENDQMEGLSELQERLAGRN